MPHWLIVLLLIAWPTYLVVMAVWIVMQRSEPVATLGWIMALAFLPYLGFLIYYLLGPQRIKRSGRRREASHTAVGARGKSDVDKDITALHRMAQSMTGFPPTTASRVDLLIDGAARPFTFGKASLEARGQARCSRAYDGGVGVINSGRIPAVRRDLRRGCCHYPGFRPLAAELESAS